MSNIYIMPLVNYNRNSAIPVLKIEYSDMLEVLYGITDWESSLKYVKKYKKTILKPQLNRILSYSWRVFYSDFKLNMDYVVELYEIYKEINSIKKNIDSEKIIYNLKKEDIKKNEIHDYLVQKLNK
tara:strand:+ start:355 stop:732 length:378 start_codon:yes stop_codon:yes gene_type:complete